MAVHIKKAVRAQGLNHGFLKHAGRIPTAQAGLAQGCDWLRALFSNASAPALAQMVVYARIEGEASYGEFLVPRGEGVHIIDTWDTAGMRATESHDIELHNVWVPDSAILGVEGRGLALAQSFVHQNRIRQAASSCGAALYCIDESVKYARERKPFGEELARNQGIQFPLVELATQVEMLRKQAHCDPLTGLSHRAHFMTQLASALEDDEGAGAGVLYFLRVSDLQGLNHTLGHMQTDALLQKLGLALKEASQASSGSSVGRLNGGDFAVCLRGVDALRAVTPEVYVAAWQEASVGAESNGLRLTAVNVNVGDVVKAGQVLATFSAETVQADVAQVRASLLEAQANAAEAAANADRARALQATGALSQQQIQQYTTAEKTAQARVEAAKATLNAQQLRLKYTQVVAPDSGVISARTATVGAVVGAGTELFRMVRKGRLEWRAEVTSTELRRIAPGAKVSVTAASGTTAEGTVRMVAPTVDGGTRNGIVYVDLPASAAQAGARAGMFAAGKLAVGQAGGLTVPQTAVLLRDGFSYVFVVEAQQSVRQVKVKVGRRQGDRIEVLEGLKEGVQVVAAGVAFLADGDTVRVVGGRS